LQRIYANRYSMALAEQDKLNKLLTIGVPHGLYFSEWLTANGWSNQLVQCYCQNGWLERLCRGVFIRKGDSPQAYAALDCYRRQVGADMHIAAHSALELHGYMHFVPMGKPRMMVALHGSYEAQWLKMDVYDRQLVSVRMDAFSLETETFRYQELELPVSSAEQAFAECLQLAPKHYSYMDLYLLMEMLTTLRPWVVEDVLVQSNNQRVKRMFLYMAEKAGHAWVEDINVEKIGLTQSPLRVTAGGTFINKYKITIPTELADYE